MSQSDVESLRDWLNAFGSDVAAKLNCTYTILELNDKRVFLKFLKNKIAVDVIWTIFDTGYLIGVGEFTASSVRKGELNNTVSELIFKQIKDTIKIKTLIRLVNFLSEIMSDAETRSTMLTELRDSLDKTPPSDLGQAILRMLDLLSIDGDTRTVLDGLRAELQKALKGL